MDPSELLRTEFDINYIAVVSRKEEIGHCIIRLILASLASPEEIRSVTKRGLRAYRKNNERFYTVKFYSKGKVRIFPVDEKTYWLINKIGEEYSSKDAIFNLSDSEIDEIIRKNSPPDRKYDARKLRKSITKILEDNLFYEDPSFDDFLMSKDLETLHYLMMDTNPLYSGVWDMDDDEAARDFIISYCNYIRDDDIIRIAKNLNEDPERITKLLYGNNEFVK
jgi:hypothetical protein